VEKIARPIRFEAIFSHAIDAVVETHGKNAAIHATLHSLTNSDEKINAAFTEMENAMTMRLSDRLIAEGYPAEDLHEKVHLAIRVIQDFAHECVYDHHDYIDYSAMRNLLVEMLTRLFEREA